ncbi:MAG: HAD family phosphatase [Caldilineaceae bacterium]
MDFQAVLFDMDGVVIDTHEPVTRFWNDLAALHRVNLTAVDFETHIYGVPADHTFDKLFPMVTGEVRRQIMAELEQDELTQIYTPVAGVLSFLKILKVQGVPTALVTSGHPWKVKRVFEQLELQPLFRTAITAVDIVRGKPAPDCYQLAAKRLGIEPANCVVFEDSLAGAQAGLAADATVIGVQSSPGLAAKLRILGVARIIDDFREFSL